jgi:hypothetical protein
MELGRLIIQGVVGLRFGRDPSGAGPSGAWAPSDSRWRT